MDLTVSKSSTFRLRTPIITTFKIDPKKASSASHGNQMDIASCSYKYPSVVSESNSESESSVVYTDESEGKTLLNPQSTQIHKLIPFLPSFLPGPVTTTATNDRQHEEPSS